MSTGWRWYISIAAVREYMLANGWYGALEEDNPDFLRAQDELHELSLTARLSEEATRRERRGSQIFRVWSRFRGRRQRYEFTVMPPAHGEGPLPALVRVRLK